MEIRSGRVSAERKPQKIGGENQLVLTSRGGVGCYTARPWRLSRPALPGRSAASLAIYTRDEAHHQRASLGGLVAPRLLRVNRKTENCMVLCVRNRGATKRFTQRRTALSFRLRFL